MSLDDAFKALREVDPVRVEGRVAQVVGLVIESDGPSARLGEVCLIFSALASVSRSTCIFLAPPSIAELLAASKALAITGTSTIASINKCMMPVNLKPLPLTYSSLAVTRSRM